MRSHQWIDQRSLAFGRAIAARLESHPEVIAEARATLLRWLTTCSPGTRRTLQEWLDILDGPPGGVIAILIGEDERATRLRQSNPFAGVLSQQERNAILLQFESHDPATA